MHQRALAIIVFLAALPLSVRADGVESFYGSFGTEVPIDVPEFHALEPRLKLSYGSSGGDGFVGVGWSLSGLSIIERVGPRQSTPTYGASDGFVLDGQELVADTSLGGTHSTRIQSYQRVRRDAAADRWYVWQKDGTRATYAPLYGTGLGTFRWAVVAIDDTRGNSVSYGWWCGGGDCYPDAITYNGTTVRFYREARPDPITFATGAGLGTTGYRLRSIDVTTGGSRVRTYRLGYATSGATRRTLLASVQLFGRDATVDASGAVLGGSSMPAMTMAPTTGGTSLLAGTWAATTAQHERNGSAAGWPSASYWAGHGGGQTNNALGDFDGDGATDMAGYAGNGQWHVCLSTGSGFSCAYWAGHGGGERRQPADGRDQERSDRQARCQSRQEESRQERRRAAEEPAMNRTAARLFRPAAGAMALLAFPALADSVLPAPTLRITRQVLHWFAADDPGAYGEDHFPIFIWNWGPGEGEVYYGFPDLGGGVKVATEGHAVCDPDAVKREVTAAEIDAMYQRHVRGRLRGVQPRSLRAATCLYTEAPGARFWIERAEHGPIVSSQLDLEVVT